VNEDGAMRLRLWQPPVELSTEEEMVAKRIRRAKLFAFLRRIPHLLFDE